MGNRSSSSTTEHSDPLIPSPSLETKTDTKSQEKTSAVAPRAPPHALMSELAKIRGMFDVHVTCDENDIYLFNHFCNLNGIASAYAVGMDGSHKQQLMTSREYQNGTGEEMVLYALELKEKLEKFGVKVRVMLVFRWIVTFTYLHSVCIGVACEGGKFGSKRR